MQKSLLFIVFLTLLAFTNCTSEKKTESFKTHADDPFINSVTESQYFEIAANTDHVVEGKKGTLLVLPKGCFVDKNGKIVTENVRVELVEALDLEEMLLSNLTTTSNGKLLETDGMIFINASADGEELTINKEIPIHIEIPTAERKAGMMAYKGIRDKKGNMNWVEPKEIKTYLIPIDMDLLDFYPEGFEAAVIQGMPFRSHKEADKELTDSLYYSLSVSKPAQQPYEGVNIDINEPYYNENSKVVDGKYTDDSYSTTATDTTSANSLLGELTEEECGINPASIKVIKEGKYKNTLLATREFEQRMRIIFKTCRNDILEIYINNLDKNLYELDSMAAVTLGEHLQFGDFRDFYKRKQTNVKEADKYAELLKGFYEKRLKKVKSELKRLQQKVRKELEKKDKLAKKLVKEYKEVLLKREQHRMETYGFDWTSTGWVNIDIGTVPKDWGAKQLIVTVENGSYYDRVFTYVVYPSINSIYRLNSTDKESFYVGNSTKKEMLMPKKAKAVTIAIAYKNDLQFLALKEFITGDTELLLSLNSSSKQLIKEALKPYNKFSKENRIEEDLKFMEKLAKEKKRQEKLKKEQDFMNQLYQIAFKCCNNSEELATGEKLFKSYCASCHKPTEQALVGPGLANTTSKYDMEFIIAFTQNSQEMIKQSERALEIYREYNKVVMPAQPVSDAEVKAIFEYIDNYGKGS